MQNQKIKERIEKIQKDFWKVIDNCNIKDQDFDNYYKMSEQDALDELKELEEFLSPFLAELEQESIMNKHLVSGKLGELC